MAISFEEFQKTAKRVVKDAEWCSEWSMEDTSRVVMEYVEGSCFIYVDHDEKGYSLILENQEWNSESLAELEKILYENWYLPVLAD